MPDSHDTLLKAIRGRSEKQTEFNNGILTADRYVKTLQDAIGIQACYHHMCKTGKGDWSSFDDVLQKAANTLTYCNRDMEVKAKRSKLPDGVELPKNTLMVFRHVLTTSRKDRDGDILRTGGAEVDPKMLLLWQHVHTLPIGKMLAVATHNKDELQLYSCVVDMNDLCHDAAVMIDNDMGRFSHGFRALDFIEIKAGPSGSPGGYDVKKFEVLEESLVSVPANPDSDTEEVILSLVEGGKLTSGLMKDCATVIRDKRPLSVPVTLDVKVSVNGQEVKSEDKSRNEEGGEGIVPGASEEAGTVLVEEKEEQGTKDKEVKAGAYASSPGRQVWSGDLGGSWEWMEGILRTDAKKYLTAMGVSVAENDWASVVGTFKDHAIICIDRMGVYEYFKVDWKMVDGVPKFAGEPKRVEIETTTKIKDKMKALRALEEKKALMEDEESGGVEASPVKPKPKPDDEDEEDEEKMVCPDCDYVGPGKEGKCPKCGAKLDAKEDKNKGKQDTRNPPEVTDEEEGKREDRKENEMACPDCDYAGPGKEGKCPKCGAKLNAKKDFTLEKLGRVLSKGNESKIRDAIDDLDEAGKMEIPRGCKALIRQAKKGLSDVMSSLGIEDGTEKEYNVKEAMAVVLAKAGSKELSVLKSLLDAFEQIKEDEEVVKQFRALVDIN